MTPKLADGETAPEATVGTEDEVQIATRPVDPQAPELRRWFIEHSARLEQERRSRGLTPQRVPHTTREHPQSPETAEATPQAPDAAPAARGSHSHDATDAATDGVPAGGGA